jgi:hypothetical protein
MYNQGYRAFQAAVAIAKKRVLQMAPATGLVTLNDATATNVVVGFSEVSSAIGEHVSARLPNVPGSVELTASGAIGRGVDAYADADGKISALSAVAGDYRLIGKTLEEATADGDVIEVLPYGTPIVTTVP